MAATTDDKFDFVSVQDAARLLRVHRSAIYQAIQSGRLTPMRLLGKTALHQSDLACYRPRNYQGKRNHASITSFA